MRMRVFNSSGAVVPPDGTGLLRIGIPFLTPGRDTGGTCTGTGRGGVSVTSHMKMPMKMAECECGFMVRSHSDNEMVKVLQMHGMDTHQMQMSHNDAMKMMKPAGM